MELILFIGAVLVVGLVFAMIMERVPVLSELFLQFHQARQVRM